MIPSLAALSLVCLHPGVGSSHLFSSVIHAYHTYVKSLPYRAGGRKPETRNTPLVRLGSLSDKTGCEILAKAEWMNPGGSVKDRAAKYLISDAEKKGALKPGGTVVEGTAGNTGIGLAHMCRARGYKCIIYIPETQSKEKMDALRYVRSSSVWGGSRGCFFFRVQSCTTFICEDRRLSTCFLLFPRSYV